jgi:hypothetical protein
MSRAVAAALIAASALFARPVLAVEREQQLGVDFGGSMLIVSGKSSPDVGGVAGIHWTYGLSDALNLMAEADWSLVALNETQKASTTGTRPSWAANADVGIGYVFDVLRWVPYAGVLVGGYDLSGGTIPGTKFLLGVAIAIGCDYRFDRTLAVGIALRQHMLTDPSTWAAGDIASSTYPSFTQAFARLEYTWGW